MDMAETVVIVSLIVIISNIVITIMTYINYLKGGNLFFFLLSILVLPVMCLLESLFTLLNETRTLRKYFKQEGDGCD